jgi:hypothetical protein
LEAASLGLLGGTRGIGDGTRGILFLLVWAETLRFILIPHVKYLMKRGVKLAGAEAVSRSVYCTSVKQAFRLSIARVRVGFSGARFTCFVHSLIAIEGLM